jgi:hypothetical protein
LFDLWDLFNYIRETFFQCCLLYLQVKGVEQELDAEDEDAALSGQTE